MPKTVFITGTSSGLGHATAVLFAQKGWQVVATMRRMDQAHLFSSCPNVRVIPLELNDSQSIRSAVNLALEMFGGVDVLVNNAGYFQMGPLETSSMDQVRQQFETNVFGLIALIQAFVPHFRSRGGGSIVNLASISAENGYPFASVYSASKAAVSALSEALNIELDPFGIRVKAIYPGTHATQIFTKVDFAHSVPQGYRPLLERFIAGQRALRGSRSEGVAQAVYRAVTDHDKDRVKYFVGPDARIIPLSKRLLGTDGHFRFFKRTLLRGMNPLLARLMPQGDAEVEVRLDIPLETGAVR